MEIDDLEVVQLELKYCEYCGGLWLRRKGDSEVYCSGCLPYIVQLPAPDLQRSRPHLPVNLAVEAENDEVFLCSEGGNA